MDDQWIDASATLERLVTAGVSRVDAESEILRHCQLRIITAKCDSIWWESIDKSKEYEDNNVNVPNWIWELNLQKVDNILNWNANIFAGCGVTDNDYRNFRLEGVKFQIKTVEYLLKWIESRNESEKYLGDVIDNQGSQLDKMQSRGRKRSESWPDWIAELVVHVHDFGFPAGNNAEGQDELMAIIDQKLEERGLSGPARSTVQPVIRAALLRHRSADK